MFTLKPFDENVITEVTSLHHPTKVKIIGIPDENTVHGDPLEIFAYYSLDFQGIYRNAKALLDTITRSG